MAAQEPKAVTPSQWVVQHSPGWMLKVMACCIIQTGMRSHLRPLKHADISDAELTRLPGLQCTHNCEPRVPNSCTDHSLSCFTT